MLALFSPAFFTKVVGACLAVLWNVQGKKNGRQQKWKRNVHYSIIGLGHSFKACERLITWGDFRQVYRGVASFSTSCRPGWFSIPHILKIARMTNTHCFHQHFELISFLANPNNAQFITSSRSWPTALRASYTPDICTCQWSTTLTTLAENWRKTSHKN